MSKRCMVIGGEIFICEMNIKLTVVCVRWESSDGKDNRVIGKTGWRDIYNYGTFENRAGVYIFANIDLQVKYIGKAGKRRMVFGIESAISRGKDRGATKVLVLYSNSGDRALSLKRDLRRKYNPPNNFA